MNKIITVFVALILMSTISIASAETLRLTQKDPNTWVEMGNSATLTYNTVGATFDYTLVGNVPNNEPYSLIYYKDQTNRFVNWGLVGAVIAENIPVVNNHIDITGSADIISLPQTGDINYPAGAKIWLVPTANVHVAEDGKTLVPDWNPAAYLFEENIRTNGVEVAGTSHLITYTNVVSDVVVGNVEVKSCPVGTVGLEITPVVLNFAAVFPGQSVSVVGTLTATTYGYDEPTYCEAPPETVVVSVVATQWTGVEGNVMPAESTVITAGTQVFEFGSSYPIQTDTPLNAGFVLTPPIGTVPDTYTQTITVTQIS
jgi:hypothetical protein